MGAAVSLNDTTQAADGKSKGSVLEWFLHLTTTKESEIATLLSRRAVSVGCNSVSISPLCDIWHTQAYLRVNGRQLSKLFWSGVGSKSVHVLSKDFFSLLRGANDVLLRN